MWAREIWHNAEKISSLGKEIEKISNKESDLVTIWVEAGLIDAQREKYVAEQQQRTN